MRRGFVERARRLTPIAILAIVCLACSPAPPTAGSVDTVGGSGKGSPVRVGDEIRVRGVVEENVRDCYVDGACFLKVRSDDGLLYEATYVQPRGASCVNQDVAEVGEPLERGARVELHGRLEARGEIDLCGSESFSVTVLR